MRRAARACGQSTHSLQGALEQWQPRLALFVPLADWNLAGQCDLSARAIVGPTDVQLPALELTVQRLQAVSETRFISEPELRLKAAGSLTREPLQLVISQADLTTSALQARATDLRYSSPAGVPQLQGTLDYQGDLGRMNAWLRSPQTPPKVLLAGRLTGQMRGQVVGDTASVELQTTVDNLALTSTTPAPAGGNAGPLWREPRVTLSAKLAHDRAADAVKLSAVELSSGMLKLTAAGQLAEFTTRRVVDLSGKLDYDLAQISRVLEPYWGNDIQLVGRQSRNFQVRGPLAEAMVASGPVGGWRQLDGTASVGWDQAKLLGLAVGPANFDATMGRRLAAAQAGRPRGRARPRHADAARAAGARAGRAAARQGARGPAGAAHRRDLRRGCSSTLPRRWPAPRWPKASFRSSSTAAGSRWPTWAAASSAAA